MNFKNIENIDELLRKATEIDPELQAIQTLYDSIEKKEGRDAAQKFLDMFKQFFRFDEYKEKLKPLKEMGW